MVSGPGWPPRRVAKCCHAGAPRAALAWLSEARSSGAAVSNFPASPARPQGFTHAQRLLSPADFTRVLKSGKRHANRWFTVIYAPGPVPRPRLGLTVSRKVSRSAVQRNRIKRLVRESFRKHASTLPAIDIVVMVRPGAAACENMELANSIETLLLRTSRACDASQSS
jgi:ribonuclease P protein component